MSESATAYAEEIMSLGEKIVGLTLKQAKELSDYLKDVHGIEAAAVVPLLWQLQQTVQVPIDNYERSAEHF